MNLACPVSNNHCVQMKQQQQYMIQHKVHNVPRQPLYCEAGP
jgi:hypothetical protein